MSIILTTSSSPTGSKSIVIQTREGNNIDNIQFFEISKFEQKIGLKIEQKYQPLGLIRRTEPSPI